MKRALFGYRLPPFVSNALFGNRKRFGRTPPFDDADWLHWKEVNSVHYKDSKSKNIISIVENAGYTVTGKIELAGKTVLEMGAGLVPHIKYWGEKPFAYIPVDVSRKMLDHTAETLKIEQIPFTPHLLEGVDKSLPLANNQVDTVFSFFSLEHMHPLEDYLKEIQRILQPGGKLVGAIPAEGGIAWGLSRYFSTRRWVKRNYGLDLSKLICWEHPNFANKILDMLDHYFHMDYLRFWPLDIPFIDINLVISFIYSKRGN